jgi:nucleoid DNA-binding protein
MRNVGVKRVTKDQLVREVSQASGWPKTVCFPVVEAFLEAAFVCAKESHGAVELRGFGTFYCKQRKPRPARNPRTGVVVKLKKRRVFLFRFAAETRRVVFRGPAPQVVVPA